ncbi:MAG: FkbM family methyltransferase [Sulfuricella denitrificans]|nr:FkbM family methyltransferase [Sulfuricella denitrificans]
MSIPKENWRGMLEDLFDQAFVSRANSIADGLLSDGPVILYGAGECSHWFHEIAMKMHGCQPVAVLDRAFRKGDTWQGIPAFAPDDYFPTEEEKREARVVISVGNPGYHGEIVTSLNHMGFANILFLNDIYEIHNPFNQPSSLADQGFDYYWNHREAIFSAFDLMADEESREVYVRFVQTHMQRKPFPLPLRPREEQYFPRDVPLAHGHDRYVCCGAYDGDTVRLLNKVRGKVDAIACFEPEPHIYARLTDYLWRHGDQLADRILTWPCAVYGNSGQSHFIRGEGLGSRISDTGESWVQCVTLDQALAGFDPTFISMDVEGAEPEVLKGAERLLRKARPDLGVCVYHSPNHAWEIPLQLNGLGLDYRFYLRNYTSFTIETVLYATT